MDPCPGLVVQKMDPDPGLVLLLKMDLDPREGVQKLDPWVSFT